MAPSSLVSAAAGFWTKCFSVYSCTATLTSRGTSFLPVSSFCVKWFNTTAKAPPKKPMTSYMRFVQQRYPIIQKQQPEMKFVDVVKRVSAQWRTLTPEQKRPFEEAAIKAQEQFKVDVQRYETQLTPAQKKQLALEKQQRVAKRKSRMRKKELTALGKPKGLRTPWNIYVSEHFGEAQGATLQAKIASLLQQYNNLVSQQKLVYKQLAEDDRIRYENEMKSWEEHMIDIGRADLLRGPTKKLFEAKKKTAKRPKGKTVKKTT